jgi:dUTP pyrophosphatase
MLPEYDRYTPRDHVIIEVTKDNFSIPRRATKMAVGFDLFATKDTTIRPLDRQLIGTGIKLQMPNDIEGQVRSRSGLAYKYGVFVLNSPGTIDPDYRGEVKVLLANMGHLPFDISRGDRIAQLVFSKYEIPSFNHTSVSLYERGDQGFGSSGINEEDITNKIDMDTE